MRLGGGVGESAPNEVYPKAAGTSQRFSAGGAKIDKGIARCKFYIMTRTQIQLPDELYRRAKAFAARKELSLAEMTRRGLELFLARYPDPENASDGWTLPVVRSGGVKVPLDRLRDFSHEAV